MQDHIRVAGIAVVAVSPPIAGMHVNLNVAPDSLVTQPNARTAKIRPAEPIPGPGIKDLNGPPISRDQTSQVKLQVPPESL